MGYYWIILMLPAFFHTIHGNCGAPPRLDFAELNAEFIDKDNFSVGENVTYGCQPGFSRDFNVSNISTCLIDSTWSTTGVFCNRRSCGNPGEPMNGRAIIDNIVFGSRVNYTCDLGYNMISKKNYRECLANGKWSNEVPVCEVQKCPPPNAITDGTFQPDREDYEYQNAVTYECSDKNAVLIGQKSLVCTAFGNWSFDPPHCREVKCDSPNVENAEKLSGFMGPYTLNSAVSFRCLAGYTMIGSSSVKCNATSQWEPPLPVCRKVTQSLATTKEKETETGGKVTQSPVTTKEKETETGEMVTQSTATTKGKETKTGGSTVTQKPSTTKKKDENNEGGNNVGTVVGGVIGGILGILFAASAIIYVCWFKKKRGGGYVAPTRKNPDGGTSSSHQTPTEQCDMKQIEAQETP